MLPEQPDELLLVEPILPYRDASVPALPSLV